MKPLKSGDLLQAILVAAEIRDKYHRSVTILLDSWDVGYVSIGNPPNYEKVFLCGESYSGAAERALMWAMDHPGPARETAKHSRVWREDGSVKIVPEGHEDYRDVDTPFPGQT